jgi:hypothetical protein
MVKFYIGESNGRHFEASVQNLVISISGKNVTLACECYEVTGINGERVVNEISQSYRRMLIANNSTLVHPQTGEYWDGLTDDEKGTLEPVGEWDFFWFVANNVDVKVVPFILNTLDNNRARLMPVLS